MCVFFCVLLKGQFVVCVCVFKLYLESGAMSCFCMFFSGEKCFSCSTSRTFWYV